MFTKGTPIAMGKTYQWKRITLANGNVFGVSCGVFVGYQHEEPTVIIPFYDNPETFGYQEYNLGGIYNYDEFCDYINRANCISYIKENPNKFLSIIESRVDGIIDFNIEPINDKFQSLHSMFDILEEFSR